MELENDALKNKIAELKVKKAEKSKYFEDEVLRKY
jgi:hypothetical protein